MEVILEVTQQSDLPTKPGFRGHRSHEQPYIHPQWTASPKTSVEKTALPVCSREWIDKRTVDAAKGGKGNERVQALSCRTSGLRRTRTDPSIRENPGARPTGNWSVSKRWDLRPVRAVKGRNDLRERGRWIAAEASGKPSGLPRGISVLSAVHRAPCIFPGVFTCTANGHVNTAGWRCSWLASPRAPNALSKPSLRPVRERINGILFRWIRWRFGAVCSLSRKGRGIELPALRQYEYGWHGVMFSLQSLAPHVGHTSNVTTSSRRERNTYMVFGG